MTSAPSLHGSPSLVDAEPGYRYLDETPTDESTVSWYTKARLRKKLRRSINDPRYCIYLPPVEGFYKIFGTAKAVNSLECGGDLHLYSLLTDVIRARRNPRNAGPPRHIVKQLLSCNETLELLMYRGFKFDLAEKKAADLFEVFLCAAYEEREPEEMLAWAMATFLPLVEALYEEDEDDLDKRNPLKRKRADTDLEDDGNNLPVERTKQEYSSVTHPHLDVQKLLFVPPATKGPALTGTEDSQRRYEHSGIGMAGPYRYAAFHILQCLLDTLPSPESPPLSSSSGSSASTGHFAGQGSPPSSSSILSKRAVLIDTDAGNLWQVQERPPPERRSSSGGRRSRKRHRN